MEDKIYLPYDEVEVNHDLLPNAPGENVDINELIKIGQVITYSPFYTSDPPYYIITRISDKFVWIKSLDFERISTIHKCCYYKAKLIESNEEPFRVSKTKLHYYNFVNHGRLLMKEMTVLVDYNSN